MVKHDWVQLQAEFLAAHESTDISAKDWCESQGLNYSSARRYIKAAKAKAKVKIAERVNKDKSSVSKSLPKPRVVGALKHGGYSKYFNKDITKLVDGTDLTDELDLCRARIHLVTCTIEEIQRRLSAEGEDKPSPEVAASLYSSLFKADSALDRNVARVESITKTLSSIRIDNVNENKILADTERSLEITKATVINAKKSIVQTELAEIQVELARKEAGGTSKIDEYIDKKVGGGVDQVIG